MLEFLKRLLKRFKKEGGLIDEIDSRDFGADVVAGKVTKDDLTDKDFKVMTPVLIHQGSTDFCVGCSRAYGSQATEKLPMSWAGAYAMGARAIGYVPKWGISVLAVCKGAVKFGTPEEKYWKYKLNKRNYFANWLNMKPDVTDNAKKHQAQSFFRIYEQRGWDRFDTFRAYLNKFKDRKIVIHTGVDAHATTIIGQKTVNGELKLLGVDSYGKTSRNYRIGRSIDGFRYFSRREANQLFSGYMVFDIERKLAEILSEFNNRVVKTVESNNCYLVKDGKKHLIPNEDIAWSHGFLLAPYDDAKLTEIISNEDLDKIPSGDDLKFEGGKNEWVIRRIKEKYKLT